MYAAAIFDFITRGKIDNLLGPIVSIYIPVLVIYAGTKEFERWQDFHESRHPGEVFVILWTVLIVGILVANFALGRNYHFPGEMISAYITVLGVLAITKKSKAMHRRRH